MRQIIRIVNISAPNFTLILNELKLNQSRRRFRILGLAPSSNNWRAVPYFKRQI